MRTSKVVYIVNFQYPLIWVCFSLVGAMLLKSSDNMIVQFSGFYDEHLSVLRLNASGPLASAYAKACTVICLVMSIFQTASLLMLDATAFRKVARFANKQQLNAAIMIAAICFVILFFVETIDRISLIHTLGWLAAPVFISIATSIFPLFIGLLAFKFGYYGERSTTR